MLTARSASRRIALRPCSVEQLGLIRSASNSNSPSKTRARALRRAHRDASHLLSRSDEAQRDAEPSGNGGPSLIEQLFPEESKRYEEAQRAAREIPRLPIETPAPNDVPTPRSRHPEFRKNEWLWKQVESSPEETSVLVLRNASLNLVEEDFRRLIPQGRHIEGWTLSQGDFYKVVPGRDFATLAQQNYYYLLFSSPVSAFTYRGHVERIHRLAAIHTPSSITSPIPPPPGYMAEGLDVHAAIQSYALVPPNQRLDLRLLKPPLSPLMAALARNNGFPSIVNRKYKMPYEVRLTLEGPQLGLSTIRHLVRNSGSMRGLSWSGGGGSGHIQIDRWDPKHSVSPRDGSVYAVSNVREHERTEQDQIEMDLASHAGSATIGEELGLKRRTPNPVYIVGFHSERAARSFVSHWHRQPLPVDDSAVQELDGDSPPIVNAEYLW